MPTPRKTITELEASGTFARNKGRYKKRINVKVRPLAPIGKAPTHMSPAHKAIWLEVTKQATPGTLGKPDRIFLEVLVNLVAKMRSGQAKPSELTGIATLLGKLTLTPHSRKLIDPAPPETAAEAKARAAEDALWEGLD